MIKGIEKFKEYFSEFKEQYVLIGGAACDIILEQTDTSFRATKDLDLVLIVEALTPEFGKEFWTFVSEGQYENRLRSSGNPQFYRFDKPKTDGFPFMLELFSRTEIKYPDDQDIVPLHISDEISSLSAILLNDGYYRLLVEGKQEIDDLVILSPLYLIPFKAKAWLDLTERKEAGQRVDSTDIKKHKNDIARLVTVLSGNEKAKLPTEIKEDMALFIEQFEREPLNPKALKLGNITKVQLVQILKKIYLD